VNWTTGGLLGIFIADGVSAMRSYPHMVIAPAFFLAMNLLAY
jgi:hypothetical protein